MSLLTLTYIPSFSIVPRVFFLLNIITISMTTKHTNSIANTPHITPTIIGIVLLFEVVVGSGPGEVVIIPGHCVERFSTGASESDNLKNIITEMYR